MNAPPAGPCRRSSRAWPASACSCWTPTSSPVRSRARLRNCRSCASSAWTSLPSPRNPWMSKTRNPLAFQCLKRCLKRQSQAFRRFTPFQTQKHRSAPSSTTMVRSGVHCAEAAGHASRKAASGLRTVRTERMNCPFMRAFCLVRIFETSSNAMRECKYEGPGAQSTRRDPVPLRGSSRA